MAFDYQGEGDKLLARDKLEVVDEELNQLEKLFLDLVGFAVDSLGKLRQGVLALQQKVVGIISCEYRGCNVRNSYYKILIVPNEDVLTYK